MLFKQLEKQNLKDIYAPRNQELINNKSKNLLINTPFKDFIPKTSSSKSYFVFLGT